MTHDEAVLLLTDLLAGRLRPEERTRVQGHLEECEDCASLAGTHEMLAGRHTPVADLVELSLHPDRLEEARRMQLQAHLDVCESCGAEATTVRRAERRAVASLGTSRRRAGSRLLPVITAAALLGLGLSAWLGLVRLPRLESNLKELQETSRPANATPQPNEPGPMVRMQYLPSAGRGPGANAVVSLEAGQPYVYLSLAVPAFDARGSYTFDVATAAGTTVWLRTVSSEDLRLMTQTPEVTLAVPTQGLNAGRFVLRLRDASAPQQAAPRLEIPFEIRTSP